LRDKEKNSEQKKKIPFSDLRFFYLSQGGEEGKGEKPREKKQRKSNTLTGQIVIYLVRVLPGREKEHCFCKQGENTPLLQKTIQ